MKALLIFILATTGLTSIVTFGKIFEPVRKLFKRWKWVYYWISCSQCAGWWFGTGIAAMFPSLGVPWYFGGFIASACAYVYYCLVEYLDPSVGGEDAKVSD